MKDESLAIIGSVMGSIIVSTIAIGTLIVLQRGSMRGDLREIRVDLGDVRERVARIEVIVGGPVNEPEPALN